jgi:hypothetical protein
VDARGWLSVMFVVAAVLPLVSFGFIISAGISERRRLHGVAPGTYGEFDAVFSPEQRAAARKRLVVDPLRDTLLVGGGVVIASVASILSLYLL